jgi:AraC family transcriptional regulator
MVRTQARAAPVNPLEERNLLSAEAVSRWAGFSIGWVEAVPDLSGSCDTAGHTLLAMLDCGRARAEFHYGHRSIERELGAGAIGLFTPGGHADVSRWRCDGVRRIMLQFDQARLDDAVLSEQLLRMPLRTELEFHDDGLAGVLRAMVHEVAEGCPRGMLYAESLSLGVAMRLQQRAASRYATPRERGRLSASQARRVEELVQARLTQSLSIGELAQAAGFSKTQFVRLFKNTFTCTPHHYIHNARLQRARALVQDSTLPLAGIAEDTGFSSQSHMTTAFLRAFGITPGELRRTHSGHGLVEGADRV